MNLSLYFTFFAVLANVYLPWINGLSYFGLLIGTLQVGLIILIFIKSYSENGKSTIYDFFDKLKSLTRGYASYDYEIEDYQESKMIKLDINVNKKDD